MGETYTFKETKNVTQDVLNRLTVLETKMRNTERQEWVDIAAALIPWLIIVITLVGVAIGVWRWVLHV